jgi:hypothetical protein
LLVVVLLSTTFFFFFFFFFLLYSCLMVLRRDGRTGAGQRGDATNNLQPNNTEHVSGVFFF